VTRPRPTPIFRLLHIDSLTTILHRGAMHAPNRVPPDGLPFRGIHRVDVQSNRRPTVVPCGPGGSIGDYVSFYLGPRSPMLLQLKTGQVADYTEGQEPLVYLVSTVEAVVTAGRPFVFTDRHSLASYAKWFDREADLDELDWATIYAHYWTNTFEDRDRKNRKQAEFLVHESVPLPLCHEIGCLNPLAQARVQALPHPAGIHIPPAVVRPQWYY
jgi:hypothetical protein